MTQASNYLTFIGELKTQILRSRYAAARLVNRELLLLYFAVGKRLSEKVVAEKWGAKVLEQISADLQREMPGLRGFSYRNLKNMRQFAEEYAGLGFLPLSRAEIQRAENQEPEIGQLATAQLEHTDLGIGQTASGQLGSIDFPIGQTASAQLERLDRDIFLGIGFSHHVLLMSRCKNLEERRF